LVYPSSFLIHSATLTHTVDAGAAATGEPLTAEATVMTVKCRFISPEESRGPAYFSSSPKVILPAGTVVSEGDTLASTVLGFAGTFQIGPVKQIYEIAQNVVSHISCEITAAAATGGS